MMSRMHFLHASKQARLLCLLTSSAFGAIIQKLPERLAVTEQNSCVALSVQFLPQDKVVGFAQMKPGELLMESERAIGDAQLHRLHKELIEDRNNLKTFERVSWQCHLL